MNVRVPRRLRIAGAVLAIGLAACDAPTATAPVAPYDFSALTGGVTYRWPLGRLVRVHVSMAGVPAGADLGGAVARGMAAWNDAPGFAEVQFVPAIGPSDADVIVYRAGVAPPVALPCALTPGGGAGVTRFCAAGSTPDSALTLPLAAGGGRAKVLVRIDTERSGAALDAVVAHELGHVLGIGGHSPSDDDLMFAAPRVTRPSARDVRTLRAVLARSPDVRL